MSPLATRLSGKRVVICAGAGGVGKTTVSAAVALGLAAQGRRVAVVTIDPARRLAEALGLDELGNQPQRVDPARFDGSGLAVDGELFAMMLDVKRTFDELIARLAPNAFTRQEILANPIYRHLSAAVAGSQEYTAIAKLFEIERERDYEVIVLDTPPSRNAIDFLEAPGRLIGFLEGRALKAFGGGREGRGKGGERQRSNEREVRKVIITTNNPSSPQPQPPPPPKPPHHPNPPPPPPPPPPQPTKPTTHTHKTPQQKKKKKKKKEKKREEEGSSGRPGE